jgi:hypothetical protein
MADAADGRQTHFEDALRQTDRKLPNARRQPGEPSLD